VRPYLEKIITKKVGEVGPEFKSQHDQKKKNQSISWRHGLRSIVFTYQAQGPQYCQKKKKGRNFVFGLLLVIFSFWFCGL
jgi:hypothetical protein